MSKVKAFGEAEWVSEKTKELDKLGGECVTGGLFAHLRPVITTPLPTFLQGKIALR